MQKKKNNISNNKKNQEPKNIILKIIKVLTNHQEPTTLHPRKIINVIIGYKINYQRLSDSNECK